MILKTRKSSLYGTAAVPGSKSHTIRGVLLGAMAEGRTVLHRPLTSLDCKSALTVARAFGARVTEEGDTWIIDGCGGRLQVPEDCVDCGNSGSTVYFAASMAALAEGTTVFTGDEQIRRRPIRPVLEQICRLGGEAWTTRPDVDACPIVVRGKMKGGRAIYHKSLSQFVSSILMVAPLLEGDTEIINEDPLEKPYLQISLDWIDRFGGKIEQKDGGYSYFRIRGGQSYKGIEAEIPADWSGVAFPLVAGVVTKSRIEICGVDFLDSQGDKAVVDCLIAMGADIEKDVQGRRLIVRGGKKLHGGVTIDMSDIPDSLPALSVAAAFAEGSTTFKGLAHIRLKETDRVAVMEKELTKAGARVETGADTMTIHGGHTLVGTRVESHGDHRVAMALAVCGMFAEGTMEVGDSQCAAVSFPSFIPVMKALGADISEEGE